jgi:hypothetical protein
MEMKTFKEKKYMKAALIIKSTMLLLICIGLTACSKDDDGSGDSNVTITGNYHYSASSSQDQYYYFKSDGTGTYEKDLSSTTGTADFTYKVSGNKITCKGVYTSTYNDDGAICNINTNWSSSLTYSNGTLYDGSNNAYVKISN